MVPGQRTMHHFYLHPKHRKYGALPMGLSEINSKNYKIILDKVKYAPLTSVPDSPEPTHSSNVNNIKTEIKQQQKYLSDEEIGEIVIKYKCGMPDISR